jgi:hypothetical protein
VHPEPKYCDCTANLLGSGYIRILLLVSSIPAARGILQGTAPIGLRLNALAGDKLCSRLYYIRVLKEIAVPAKTII